MTALTDAARRRLGVIVYWIAIPVILVPVFDWFVAVWPFHPGLDSWRFGAIGLVGQGLINGTIGVLLLYLACSLRDHAGVRMFVTIVAACLTLLLAALALDFLLDALQLRRAVRPEMLRSFDFNFVRTAAVVLYFAALYATLTVVLWKQRRSERRREDAEPALVGSLSRKSTQP